MYIFRDLQNLSSSLIKVGCLTCVLSTGGILLGSISAAAEEHYAHVHGIGSLNVVQQERDLIIEFSSPSANIVGFEHAAENHTEKEAVEAAIELLKSETKVFQFSDSAECALEKITIKSDQLGEDYHSESDHEAHDEHDEHDEHDDHDEHHEDDEHDEHDEHHEDHGDEMVHSEFSGEYHFECTQPENLDEIQIGLFSLFPGIEKLDVQVFSVSKQTSFSLTPKKTTVQMK